MLKTSLYKKQAEAVRLFKRKKQIALFMEPGTGKTITAFGCIEVKKERVENPRILVICPKNIIGSWEDEIAAHLIKSHGCEFQIMNYEQVRIHIESIAEEHWDFIIVDESHRIKNRRAKTTKALWKLEATYKIIMSGTPVTKDEIDLWSQYKFLNDKLWGAHFNSFEAKCLRKVDRGDYFVHEVQKKSIKPFMAKAAKFTYRVKLDDIAEMPPRRDVKVFFDLKGSARKAYTDLEQGFLTEHRGQRASIDLSVTSLLRLQQLAGGHLVLENGDVIRHKDQPKLWWILDKLEDIGKQKLFIVCRFKLEIQLISAALKKAGYKYVVMQGGMTSAETSRVRKRFQTDKTCQVLIGQVATVKEGNNFQKQCRYGVFYSKSMSYVEIEQCKARLWRNGQTRKVIYYHLIMRNTIDEAIETIVEKKYRNAEAILYKLVMKGKSKMAKEEKAVKAKKKSNLPKIERPEWGIEAVAKALKIDARSVRVKLRNAEVEKSGKFYDFKNQAGVDKIVKLLSPKEKKAA